ncbi:N-myristoyl transferase [Ecytonucleospora hepatopenaei]|uniref:Glycylpeptide N-tetradecanoyltransferase n=1 Tax=Ecytonucleospora hepatopenaei TaxID=646526 RepID=A0A1W0E8X2_9MICR|nr:N-myristoyl transferase [Ecytonucleospora hepatopenaei]
MLINDIKRNAYINGIYTAIFTGERNLGFAFTEVEYYHYILNINRLRKLIYIPYDYINSTNTIYNDDILNSNILNSNILNSNILNSNTRLINNDDDNDFIYINQLLLKYNQCNVCNIQLYEVFNDIDALRDNFKIIDNFNYTLINKQEGTFITFYIMYIDNKLYDTNNTVLYDNNNINSNNSNNTILYDNNSNSNNTILYDNNSKYIKKAILQYHNIGNNTNNNNIQILDDAFTFCKSIGVDMFDVLNIAGNDIHIIDKYPFLHGTGKLYYHFYNYNMLPIGRSKINFILY